MNPYPRWQYNEMQQVGTDYFDEKNVESYDLILIEEVVRYPESDCEPAAIRNMEADKEERVY
ncbi:MAG TPA: hypothetical protein VN368_01435 [Candidatus Methylomirabilis sp.]|nr:hypothetical protein [Candidatus Methylomirabilis sp.]